MSPVQFKIALIAIIICISSSLVYLQKEQISDVVQNIRPAFDLVTPGADSEAPESKVTPVTDLDEESVPVTDTDNLLRSEAQCKHDFPELYDSIDASISHYQKRPIQRDALEKTFSENEFTWVVIRNNQLFVRSRHHGWQSRVQAVLADLHRAIITSPERLPDVEFLFNTADSAPDGKYTPVFGLSRGLDERAFLIPDFGYWAWPEPHVNGFTEFENQVARLEKKIPWDKKVDQLFWRGAAKFNTEREQLVSISEQHSDTWGNVRNIDWSDLKEGDLHDMADHCKFKFLAHMEGVRYSARLKYLQHCNSVIVTHERKWTTHLSHLMKSQGADQNIVVVGPDFTGVDEVMQDLLSHKEEAKKIADNSQEMFGKKYGRLGAEVCYWRQLIRGYHSVMTPAFQRSVTNFHHAEGAKDYESVMLMGKTEWEIA